MTSVSGSGYLLFLSLLTAAECDLVVVDTAGNNVILPCKYDITNGVTSICWGRGDIPASKCNNQLIATDGATVRKDSLVSSRYQLLGDVERGDVSMTILNVSEMDSGRYGCRVEIKGWFNDHKNPIELRVQKDTKTIPKRELDNVTSTEQTPLNYTQAAHINSTWYRNSSEPVVTLVQERRSSPFPVSIIYVLIIASIAVVGVGVYFIKRSGKFSKSSQIISLSGPGPNNREENIYQMDEVNAYQSCP
ncbi:unnamed protein product [Lota lota]